MNAYHFTYKNLAKVTKHTHIKITLIISTSGFKVQNIYNDVSLHRWTLQNNKMIFRWVN